MRGSLALFLSILAACSGGPDDPGDGTGTLRVVARGLIGSQTDVTIEITARGIPVIDAEVGLTGGGDATTAALSAAPGLYQGRLRAPVETLELDIVAGEDRVSGAIGGPLAFDITRPTNGVVVERGTSNQLFMTWSRPDEEAIDRVTLAIIGADALPTTTAQIEGDPGEGRVDLPTAGGDFRAEVRRRDVVGLAGGTEGSELSLERRASVGFFLQ